MWPLRPRCRPRCRPCFLLLTLFPLQMHHRAARAMAPGAPAGVPGGIVLPGTTGGIDPAQLQMQLPGGSPVQPPVTPTPVLAHLDQNPKTKGSARTPYTAPPLAAAKTTGLIELPGKDHNLYWLPAGDEIRGLEEEVRIKDSQAHAEQAAARQEEEQEKEQEEQAEYNSENHNPGDADSPVEAQIHGWEPPLAKGGLAQTNPFKLNSDAFEDRRRRRRRLLSALHNNRRLRGERAPPNSPEDLWSTMQTKDDPFPNLLNGGGAQGKGYVMPAMKPEGEVEIPDGGSGSESDSGSALAGEENAAAQVATDIANTADFSVPKGTFGRF
jgi:hypothetical protein